MLGSPNNGATFLSYNFSNLRQLLRSVSIGGLPFTRTAYGRRGRILPLPEGGGRRSSMRGQTCV